MVRLKTTQVKEHRETLLQEQKGLCGLCGEPISPEEAVLDHNHKSGRVRKVLHRGCNVIEGVIANNAVRNRISTERLKAICENLIPYLLTSETDILHPTHRTAEEKKERIKKRAKRRKIAANKC
jgi:hypothetical protein